MIFISLFDRRSIHDRYIISADIIGCVDSLPNCSVNVADRQHGLRTVVWMDKENRTRSQRVLKIDLIQILQRYQQFN